MKPLAGLVALLMSWSLVQIGWMNRAIELRPPPATAIPSGSYSASAGGQKHWNIKRSSIDLPLHAIVQLRDLKLSAPQVQGQATLPLQQLPESRSFTANLLVGGQSARFLIDTGASTSLVAGALVQKLGLTGQLIPREKLALAVSGNDCPDIYARLHQLPRLTADTVQIEGLQALEFPTIALPGGVSGVLGMDVLNNFDVQINPQTRQLQLSSPSQLPKTGFNQAVFLQARLGVMLAQVQINGKGPFTFLLDTGADSIFISQAVAQQLNLDALPHQSLQVEGFCGLEDAEQLTLAQVDLQGHHQTNLEGIVLSSSILQVLQVDGILGQTFFNQYQQHWRFTPIASDGVTAAGSLLLTPLNSDH
jgi:predicted aspartyl protease